MRQQIVETARIRVGLSIPGVCANFVRTCRRTIRFGWRWTSGGNSRAAASSSPGHCTSGAVTGAAFPSDMTPPGADGRAGCILRPRATADINRAARGLVGRRQAHLGGCLVALVLPGSMQVMAATRTPDAVIMHVRVYAERGVDRSTVERSQDVARRLLSSAGIDLVWRLCEPTTLCDPETRPPREIPVIFSAEALRKGPENCGRAAIGPRMGTGAVRVSVPCVAGVAARLATNRVGAVHPLLKLAAYDDVLGAVVAHELGHVLGLQHARGVMHARLDANDILALRIGNLTFSASQSARMRTLLAGQVGEDLAGR